MADWTLLTNHAFVLLCVAEDPGLTLREIGDRVGITERTTHRIMCDLVGAGYLVREREGRCNRYRVMPDAPLRHPLVREHGIGEILTALGPVRDAKAKRPRAAGGSAGRGR